MANLADRARVPARPKRRIGRGWPKLGTARSTDRQTDRKSEERAAKAAHDLALEAASAEPAVLLEGRAPLSST